LRKVAEDQTDTNHKLLTGMAILMERSERTQSWQNDSDKWRADHDRDDTKNFAEIRADVASLKTGIGAVTSTVNSEQLSNRYTLKDIVVGCLAFAGALGAFIAFVGWYLSHGTKP
jgi:hypothetical protein